MHPTTTVPEIHISRYLQVAMPRNGEAARSRRKGRYHTTQRSIRHSLLLLHAMEPYLSHIYNELQQQQLLEQCCSDTSSQQI
jgi:hypothetical protein